MHPKNMLEKIHVRQRKKIILYLNFYIPEFLPTKPREATEDCVHLLSLQTSLVRADPPEKINIYLVNICTEKYIAYYVLPIFQE